MTHDPHLLEIDALLGELKSDVNALSVRKESGSPGQIRIATVELIEIRNTLAGMVGNNGGAE